MEYCRSTLYVVSTYTTMPNGASRWLGYDAIVLLFEASFPSLGGSALVESVHQYPALGLLSFLRQPVGFFCEGSLDGSIPISLHPIAGTSQQASTMKDSCKVL